MWSTKSEFCRTRRCIEGVRVGEKRPECIFRCWQSKIMHWDAWHAWNENENIWASSHMGVMGAQTCACEWGIPSRRECANEKQYCLGRRCNYGPRFFTYNWKNKRRISWNRAGMRAGVRVECVQIQRPGRILPQWVMKQIMLLRIVRIQLIRTKAECRHIWNSIARARERILSLAKQNSAVRHLALIILVSACSINSQ